MSELPDEQLASRVAEGDDGAFEALYRRYRESVLALCRAMLGDPHDAEEATQAAMLCAYRALGRGDRPRAVRAWLIAIARNECRDLHRRRPATVPLSGEVAATTLGPAEQLERRERIAELSRDLADLPRGQRTALMLRGLGGMRHAEIAEVVGGSERAARSLVHEARESLGEFEQGRALDCAEVRERIQSGDGRALRARRIRAHLRVCDECREAAGARRGGLGTLLPAPLVAAVRGLLAGGNAGVPIAGGAAIASLAAIGVLVLPGPWAGDAGRGPGSASAASAAAQAVPVSATTSLVGARAPGGAGDPAASGPAGARRVPQPGAAPSGAPGSAPVTTTPSAPAPEAGAAPGTPASAGSAATPVTTSGASPPAAVSGTAPVNVSVTTPVNVPVTVPRVTVPRVTVPAVTVPSVTVPSVTIPPVTVRPVTVGPVTIPRITVPRVTAPAITTPAITTPAITTPAITTPAITTPPVVVQVPSTVTTPALGPVPPVTVHLPVGGDPPIALP